MNTFKESSLSALIENIASYFGYADAPDLPQEDAKAAEPTDPIPDALAEALRGRGVVLAQTGAEQARLLAGTGWLMGEHSAVVSPLLRAVLAQGGGGAVRFDLRQSPTADIGILCQFGQSLAKLGILDDFLYQRAPQYLLTARVRDCPEGRHFLASGWFPHYGRNAILRALGQPRPPHVFNARLQWTDGSQADFDLLALAQGRLLGVRFGCDDLQATLAELGKVANALAGLDPGLFLVLPRVDAGDVSPLASCYAVSVCDREGLDLLLDQLEAHPGPRAEEPQPANTSVF